MNEIWKTIKGYEDYQISNLGRVKSLKFDKVKILRVSIRDNYLTLHLCKNGKGKTFKLHRLIAKHHIDNPNNYPIVRHLNDIKTDNRIENLAWGTISNNNLDCVKNGNSPKAKKLLQFDTNFNYLDSYLSRCTAERNYNLKFNNLTYYIKNKKKCKDFYWCNESEFTEQQIKEEIYKNKEVMKNYFNKYN